MSESLPAPKRLPSARLLEAGLRAGRQMSNEAQMTQCRNIFLFYKKIEDQPFFNLGFGFHLDLIHLRFITSCEL
jgi:hypothetical protein